MLRFDHCYTADPGHRFLKKLESLGFALRPSMVEHPGKQFCRFLAFHPSKNVAPAYLEFIRVGKGGKPVSKPGLSLTTKGLMRPFFQSLQVPATFVHKNYKWKEDSRSKLPGWNFVNFTRTGFRTLFFWLTEYEPRDGMPRGVTYPIIRHPNGAERLIAIELEVNEAGEKFFKKILKKNLDRPVKMPGQQTFYFLPGKKTRLTAVVIECRSLKALDKCGINEELEWRGRPARVIRNPSGMWNIILVSR